MRAAPWGLWLFDAGQEHAADDVGVHACARDILADLLDDQQVDALDEEAGHGAPRFLQKLRLAALELSGLQGLDAEGLFIGVFDEGHTHENRRFVEDAAAPSRDQAGEALGTTGVGDGRAFVAA